MSSHPLYPVLAVFFYESMSLTRNAWLNSRLHSTYVQSLSLQAGPPD